MPKIRSNPAGTNVMQLSDSDGTATWELKDSDGFTVFKVDSKGNVKIRGKVTRV